MTNETNRPTLTIYRGVAGSGKSTDARAYVAEKTADSNYTRSVVIVERDMIRREVTPKGPKWYKHEFEGLVTNIHEDRIKTNLAAGNDVICSDTNLPNRTVKRLIEIGVRAGAKVEIADFRTVSLADCISNNTKRYGTDGYVDPSYIVDKYNRFIKGATLTNPEIPTLESLKAKDAAAALSAEPYVPSSYGVPTVLVDLDGTLADHNGRNPYDTTKYHEDLVSGNVLDVVLGLDAMGYRIDIMTGRDAAHERVCREWLHKMRIPYTSLHMRPEGNKERDDKVKLDLFETHYRKKDGLAVQFCIDDRDRVVSMYRNVLGLQVLQVAEGNF